MSARKHKHIDPLEQTMESRGHLDGTFAWVERGLEVARSDRRSSFADHELPEMKRDLLAQLGRAEDALESAWAEFREHPSTFTYKELMRYVPAKGKKAWHEKAMEATDEELEDLATTRPSPWRASSNGPIPAWRPECTGRSACGSLMSARASTTSSRQHRARQEIRREGWARRRLESRRRWSRAALLQERIHGRIRGDRVRRS
ncbi:hypothetical protein MYX78_07750 [Acidobacteria bacterium AH-259-G07]|nr:hypothetical protein [Acidobacteria bacterium AH-259-G07]